MICSRCKVTKPDDEFRWKNQSQDKRADACKPCQSEYHKQWYEANKVRRRAQIGVSQKKAQQLYRDRIFKYLTNHPCVDCGEQDTLVLQFDHRDPKEKTGGIGDMVRRQRPWSLIEKEISLCDVRCANCHVRRTAHQFNWAKLMPLK